MTTARGSNWQAHMRELAQQAARRLEGTCQAIYDLGEEYQEAMDDSAFCAVLDSLVFECQCCNWWHGQAENAARDSAEWICRECATED